eukprot:TRINITY_DN9243_c0_g1::TRINITY_DN9243_c0_g1_i1::g.13245::m.13245 TRINITY_DN9243_c0_g1::TRINITY_DN9243_c0_g1_i1::g.13245  ORF type:complete len:135 (-),score=4.14 TRINITY_DN9243_c0_g1_i1:75-479(-)
MVRLRQLAINNYALMDAPPALFSGKRVYRNLGQNIKTSTTEQNGDTEHQAPITIDHSYCGKRRLTLYTITPYIITLYTITLCIITLYIIPHCATSRNSAELWVLVHRYFAEIETLERATLRYRFRDINNASVAA